MMRAIIAYVLVSIVALGITIYLAVVMQPKYKVINCGVAEISPDFTTEMREACRRARMEKTK
jgi:hypothetical protein